jgi:photosystem II stability/assembly factor-like uncharacterized protein
MRILNALLAALILACSAPVASSPRLTSAESTALSVPTNATPSRAVPASATSAVAQVPAGTALWAAWFIDEQTGWVIAASYDGHGLVLGTSDGGKSWVTLASLEILPAGGLTQLRFVDARSGWLLTSVLLPGTVGGCAPPSTAPPQCRTVIFRTSDGGRSWREQLSVEQPSKLGPGLRGLSAVDDRHAWAIRLAASGVACSPFNCNLEVVATSDGERWESVALLPAFSDQLDFIDQRRGWAATYTARNEPGQPLNTATVIATHDGGRTWTPQLSIAGQGQFQIDFTDQHSGWALVATNDCVGMPCTSHSLYRTTDGGGSWMKLQDAIPPTSWWSPSNNVHLLGGPHFASASIGWIPVLYDGSSTDAVLLTTDGGRTWSRGGPASSNDVWDIHDLAVSGQFAWVVGERIGDEMWFVARSDAGAVWRYELTISR